QLRHQSWMLIDDRLDRHRLSGRMPTQTFLQDFPELSRVLVIAAASALQGSHGVYYSLVIAGSSISTSGPSMFEAAPSPGELILLSPRECGRCDSQFRLSTYPKSIERRSPPVD